MWPRVLRFLAALIAAAFAWHHLTPHYNRVLAAAASPLMKIDRRFEGARAEAVGRIIRVGGFVVPSADIPAGELTYNVILLTALFASNPRPLRRHNLAAFLISLAIVVALHVVAVLLSIESTYAVRMGTWSAERYGVVARYIWMYAEIFYRLVGMFGAVFLCWWTTKERA
jgi:hypothetical protein